MSKSSSQLGLWHATGSLSGAGVTSMDGTNPFQPMQTQSEYESPKPTLQRQRRRQADANRLLTSGGWNPILTYQPPTCPPRVWSPFHPL